VLVRRENSGAQALPSWETDSKTVNGAVTALEGRRDRLPGFARTVLRRNLGWYSRLREIGSGIQDMSERSAQSVHRNEDIVFGRVLAWLVSFLLHYSRLECTSGRHSGTKFYI
jgi:hypothetical protein